MDYDQFMALCKDGKFKDALAMANGSKEKAKYSPSRFSLDKKNGKPIFYRGNKRVELDAAGEWQISKNTNHN